MYLLLPRNKEALKCLGKLGVNFHCKMEIKVFIKILKYVTQGSAGSFGQQSVSQQIDSPTNDFPTSQYPDMLKFQYFRLVYSVTSEEWSIYTIPIWVS